MPLVINSLGGRHTHAYRHCGQKQFQETSRVPAFGWRTPDLTNIHQIFAYHLLLFPGCINILHVGNINADLTLELIENSTAGFYLKIQGKIIYLTPLLALKKFCK